MVTLFISRCYLKLCKLSTLFFLFSYYQTLNDIAFALLRYKLDLLKLFLSTFQIVEGQKKLYVETLEHEIYSDQFLYLLQ